MFPRKEVDLISLRQRRDIISKIQDSVSLELTNINIVAVESYGDDISGQNMRFQIVASRFVTEDEIRGIAVRSGFIYTEEDYITKAFGK